LHTRPLVIISVSFIAMFATPAHPFETRVLESVVSVLPDWSASSRPTQGQRRGEAPEGTAVAVFKGGYLMTNDHVLGDATTADIRLNDGRLMAVEIIGRDRRTDLALLKAPFDFPVLPLSGQQMPGDPVCAIGNQFGLGLSVTCGVISATHRAGTGFNAVEDFIQTDATVNPGGSGGALVTPTGQLAGLLSAIFTKQSDASIGVNFATDSNLVMRIASDLRTMGRVDWGDAGLRTAPLSRVQRRKWSGLLIVQVTPDGGAEKAGLMVGDILTKIGDRLIFRPGDDVSAVANYRPGDRAPIWYLRDGMSKTTYLTLQK